MICSLYPQDSSCDCFNLQIINAEMELEYIINNIIHIVVDILMIKIF